jgi:hypothetical protein
MTFSAIRSINISSTDFSTVLRSLDMHTRNQISRVGEQTLKVRKMGGEVSKAQCDSNQFFVSLNISGCKSGPGATFDGLNKQCRNGFLQWVRNALINTIPSIMARSQWSNGDLSNNNCVSSHSRASF